MSIAKEIIVEVEEKMHNKLEGYRKKIRNEGKYSMDCPYCCNALSNDDVMKKQCIHCGYLFKWNDEF